MEMIISGWGHSLPSWPAASPGMVHYAAESGSELSYGNAAGPTRCLRPLPLMARPSPTRLRTVSASALALHLDCSRTYIGKLEAEGVIQRQGDGSARRTGVPSLHHSRPSRRDESRRSKLVSD